MRKPLARRRESARLQKAHIARLGIDDIFGKIDINTAKFVNELSEILRINRYIMGQLDAQEAVHRANQARAASEARISPSEVREEPSVDTRVFEGSEIA